MEHIVDFVARHAMLWLLGLGTLWVYLFVYVVVKERTDPRVYPDVPVTRWTLAHTLIAFTSSLVLCGLGQVYNREWTKALLYLLSAALLFFFELSLAASVFAALDAALVAYRMRSSAWVRGNSGDGSQKSEAAIT